GWGCPCGAGGLGLTSMTRDFLTTIRAQRNPTADCSARSPSDELVFTTDVFGRRNFTTLWWPALRVPGNNRAGMPIINPEEAGSAVATCRGEAPWPRAHGRAALRSVSRVHASARVMPGSTV